MSKSNSGDMDFEEMTDDQLAEFDKEENLKLAESSPVVEEKVDETPEETVEEEKPVEEPLKQEEVQPEEDEIDDPFFRGKSRKDMYEIIKQNNAMISKQGNEKHEIMKRLEALEAKKKEEAEKQDDGLYYTNEEGAKVPYNNQDIKVIEQIAERKYQAILDGQKQQTQKQIEEAKQSNEKFWEVLAIANPVLKSEIEKTVLDEINKDPKSTLERKDWLKNYVSAYKKPSGGFAAPKTNIVSKKLKAATVGAGAFQKSMHKKSVDSMSADEYLEYAEKNLGVKIPKQFF